MFFSLKVIGVSGCEFASPTKDHVGRQVPSCFDQKMPVVSCFFLGSKVENVSNRI